MKCILFFLVGFCLFLSSVQAEELNLSIGSTPNSILFLKALTELDEQNDLGEVGYDYLILNRKFTEQEIDYVYNSLLRGVLADIERNKIKDQLYVMNALIREMQEGNLIYVRNLTFEGYIKKGIIYFRHGDIGDIIAKRESWRIQVNKALINFSENKIYIENGGYFSVYDDKTKAWYFYEAYDEPYERDMKITYTYDKLGSFWLDAPNTEVRIYCYLPGDDFCSYVNYFIDQGQDFALNIRDLTRISGIFSYTWVYNSFLIKKNSSGLIVAGIKVPLVKRFLYSSYFDLRSKNLEFLISEAKNKYLFCYGELDGKLQYSLAKECEFKMIDEGMNEIGITTEIQTKNVKILKPSNKEELEKIINILRSS